jgi:hypothetical protein
MGSHHPARMRYRYRDRQSELHMRTGPHASLRNLDVDILDLAKVLMLSVATRRSSPTQLMRIILAVSPILPTKSLSCGVDCSQLIVSLRQTGSLRKPILAQFGGTPSSNAVAENPGSGALTGGNVGGEQSVLGPSKRGVLNREAVQ